MDRIPAPYATLDDVELLFRPLTDREARRCVALLPAVSDLLRQAARNVGQDLDARIEAGKVEKNAARLVTVDVVARVLRQSTTGEPLSQESQTALGYNWQGTYAIPGGGVGQAIMHNDLRRLGIISKTRLRGIELYDPDQRRTC